MGTVLLVEQDEALRQALEWELQREPAVEIVGTTGTAVEALELARRHQPTLVVTSMRLLDSDGLTLCRAIKAGLPATRVLFFTGDLHEMSRHNAFKCGASAYIRKPCS